MVISGIYRWLLGLRTRPHQGGCSSPLDPRLLPGSMLRIDMAWPPGKYRFQRPLLKSSSGSKGCCGTGFRTLLVQDNQSRGESVREKQGLSCSAETNSITLINQSIKNPKRKSSYAKRSLKMQPRPLMTDRSSVTQPHTGQSYMIPLHIGQPLTRPHIKCNTE